jgi:uncharacterized membrane protein YcaP (DUF421 family)
VRFVAVLKYQYMFAGVEVSLLPEEGVTMWFPSPLVLEQLVVRAIVVYGLVLLLLRFTGKRQIGQLAPFDLVLLLMLSNAVQNALNGGDNSVVGGLLSATVLVALNSIVSVVTSRSKRAEAFIEGHPLVLIHNGKLYDQMMRGARVTHHELNAALREAGCGCVEDVQYAVLENNGAISVVARKD